LSATSPGLGLGACFTATLPLFSRTDEKDDPHDLLNENGNDIEQSEMISLRVLVVDDVASNRKLLCRLLENSGHKCEVAENGLQAVEMVKKSIEEGNLFDSV